MNSVILVGNLASDVEMREVGDGRALVAQIMQAERGKAA